LDADHRVVGIYTDGDLRRTLDRQLDLRATQVAQVMTPRPKITAPGVLAAEALQLMERNKINGLLVTDEQNRLIGALNMHDLLRARVL
jgi:arabinose-5-phosphate isomerase